MGYIKDWGKKASDFLDPSTHKQDKAAEDALKGMGQAWDIPVPELGQITPEDAQYAGDFNPELMDLPPDLLAREIQAEPDIAWKDAVARQANRAGDVRARDVSAQTGRLSTLGPTAMEGVSADPRLKDAQIQALNQLSDITKNGGLTLADQAALSKVRSEAASSDRGRREAILQNMAARGMGGSGMELLAQLQSNQAASDREAQGGLDQAAIAQQRALQALMQQGQLAGSMRGQDFGEQAQVAGAKDAINQFNAQNANQMSMFNAGQLNNMGQFNAGQDLGAQQFNAGQTNAMNQFNTGQANNMAQFNTQGGYNAAAGNRDARLNTAQFNANAANNMAQFNQGTHLNVGQANMAAKNAAGAGNRDARQGVMNTNTQLHNAAQMQNTIETPMAQYGMQAQKAAGKSGASSAGVNFYTAQGDRKAKQQGEIVKGLFSVGQGMFSGGGAADAASDKRVKTDISDISDSELDEFLGALKPKAFRYKEGADKSKKAGFMMQDVEDTDLGDLISRDLPGGIKGYDQQALQGVILAALKRLSDKGDA